MNSVLSAGHSTIGVDISQLSNHVTTAAAPNTVCLIVDMIYYITY